MSKAEKPISGNHRPPTVTSVRSVIEQGQMVNTTRCRTSQTPIKVPCKPLKKDSCLKDVSVCKILWPEELKHPDCKHSGGTILNRTAMSSKLHCSFLALPKKHITRPWPKWVERKIHPCSLRVNELSEPNMLRLLNNFDFHLDHLSIFQIENYLKKITKGDYTTPEAALHMLKQSVQDRQKSVCRQRKEEKKFNEKLAEKHADDLKQIASCAIKHFEDIILDPQPLKPSEELTKYSEVILGNICRLLRQNVPSRDSENFKEQILCKIADKVAFCMIEFIKQSDFKNPPTFKIKTCEQFIKKCNPIEEIQREDKSFSSDGDVEGDQVQSKTDLGKENNDKAQGSGLNKQASNTSPVDKERKLSFLRLSQINFDGLNCGEENEKAEEMRAQRATERAAKSAAKASRKLGRQNAKKAKNAKKGGEGAQDDDCLGNADKRPQWEVEWVDRS